MRGGRNKMMNNVFRKSLAIGIMILFLGASFLPSISGNTEKNIENLQISDNNTKSSYTIDWWPMFRHDLTHSGFSTDIGPEKNDVLWSYKEASFWFSSPAVANDKVYFGSTDNKVYCLNADTGGKIWDYTTGDDVHSSPAVANGNVYIGSRDNKVYCLNADTGAKIWSYTTGYCVDSSPAVANGKVYIGSNDNKVYCLNADTGGKIWEYTTGGVICSSPAIVNNKIYFGSWDYKFYCLNSETGGKIWEYTTGGVICTSSPSIVYGKVYFGSNDNKVYCLNADTGAKFWTYTTGSNVAGSSPAVADGKVYIGSTDNKVYCLNADTGGKIWTYATGDIICHSSPAVANGKVYIGSNDNKVYCLNADTGGKIWDYTTGGIVCSSPAISNGKVYIGSDAGLYCFGGGNQPYYFVHMTDTHIGATGAVGRLSDTLDHIRNFNPGPAFIVISGDLLDESAVQVGGDCYCWGDYFDEFINCFYKTVSSEGRSKLYLDSAKTIPVYICPGNHDYRWCGGLSCYFSHFDYPMNNDCYEKYYEDTQIVSVNSGEDLWYPWDWVPPWDRENALEMPEGTGLYQSTIDYLTNILDNNYLKIIFMHHPVINYYDCWDDGCIKNRKDAFLTLCEDNYIGLVLCGHTHDFDVYEYSVGNERKITSDYDGDSNGHRFYLTNGSESSYTRTLNVQTPAIKTSTCYRNISVSGDEMKVYYYEYAEKTATGKLQWYIGPGLPNNNESKIARLHVYDSQGNHIGENESGDLDFQIDGGFYSPLIGLNETLYGIETSVYFGDDDYTFVIEGLEDGNIDFKCDYYCGDIIGDISAIYRNVSILNGSIGKLYVKMDSINHTIFMDDDGDGNTDREIEPTMILAPPDKPQTPSGPANGKPGIEYTYTSSTTDLTGDQIYYFWDWGDGNYSGWIGPYSSGETVKVGHIWTKKGSYQIKVKAKDIYDYGSKWSDPLSVTMPRNKAINLPFLQFLQNFLQDHPNLFPILQKIIQRLGLQ